MIHAHFGENGLLARDLVAAGLLRGPVITSFYGYDVSAVPRREAGSLYGELFRDGAYHLALSNHMAAQLRALGCPEAKVGVHRIGVRLERFGRGPSTLASGPVRVLMIARMVEKKGIPDALEAIHRVLKERVSVTLQIVGDGPQRADVEGEIARLGLGDAVELLGWQTQEQTAKLLSESDLLLAPSITASDGDTEGTPTAILEAMAASIPVLSTVHSGIPELVSDGETGFLVPERDVEALTERLIQLARDPSLRQRMGVAASEKVRLDHDHGVLATDLTELYRRVGSW